MKPLLKWAGGKRWFARRFPGLQGLPYGRYVEPFLGSGAVYFHLEPQSALLGDENAKLIAFYKALKQDWQKVSGQLEIHASRHCENYYYKVRSSDYLSPFDQAAQLLYLNRTCWNGLYRENLKGIFNVPKGTKDSVIFPDDDFRGVARLLKRAVLRKSDFEEILGEVGDGDLVFIDPPYTVKHNNNGFVKYNERIFSWSDQTRLADATRRLAKSSAKIIITNAYHDCVLDLYKSFAEICDMNRISVLAGDAAFRGSTKEALILINCSLRDLVAADSLPGPPELRRASTTLR